MISFETKHKQRRSFADFLPWAMEIEDGVVLMKDGGFMVSYDVKSVDFGALSVEAQDYVIRRLVASMSVFDRGWSFHYDYVREPMPPLTKGEFPDPITQHMDDARVERLASAGAMFSSVSTLSVRWTPPKNIEMAFFEKMALLFGKKKAAEKATQQDRLFDMRLKEFVDSIGRFEDAAADVLQLGRMATHHYQSGHYAGLFFSPMESHLLQTIYGFRRSLTSHPPSDGLHLDCKMAVGDFHAGLEPWIDGQYISIISVDGFPQETVTGMLQALASLPIEYRWSTRFLLQSPSESEREMNRYKRKWEQSSASFVAQFLGQQGTGAKSSRASMMVADIEAAQLELSEGGVRYGHFTSVFVLRHHDKEQLRVLARSVRSEMAKCGCVGRIERENATEAFMGSLPGITKSNVRKPLLHTLHLANMIPLTNPWAGEPLCPSPLIEDGKATPLMRVVSDGSSGFDFNLHVKDVGHTLVFGATGSGKSVLLAMLAAQWRRYRGARVVAFDKGQSLRTLAHAVGGVWHELGMNTQSGFKPLAVLAGNDDVLDSGDKIWLNGWIEDIVRLNDQKLTTEQRNIIADAVDQVSEKGRGKTMMDLHLAVQDEDVRQVLSRYCSTGPYSKIFDPIETEGDVAFDSDFIVYEIEELHDLPAEITLPLLLFIFRATEKAATGAPTLILLDEAWALLAHAVFADKIKEWLKTLRKKNCAVVMATQSLSDAINSGLIDVLKESCPTKLYGSNPEAEGTASADYQSLGLLPADIHIISRLRAKREYYLQSGPNRRVFDMMLGPDELCWVGVSDPDTVRTIVDLRKNNPDNWQSLWASGQVAA